MLPVGVTPAWFGDEDKEVVVRQHGVLSICDLGGRTVAAENGLCEVFPGPRSHVQSLGFRSVQKLCLSKLTPLIVARDNVTDAGHAISLANARQDVYDTLDHLLG